MSIESWDWLGLVKLQFNFIILFLGGAISASFCLFSAISHYNFNINWKSTHVVLGNRTSGTRLIGAQSDPLSYASRRSNFIFLWNRSWRACNFHVQINKLNLLPNKGLDKHCFLHIFNSKPSFQGRFWSRDLNPGLQDWKRRWVHHSQQFKPEDRLFS